MESSARSNFGLVTVAVGSHRVDVGNCEFNAKRIISMMGRAKGVNARILFLNELGVTGYSCGDLFRQPVLHDATLKALEAIRVASLSEFDGMVVVGAPLIIDAVPYNCAVVINRGKILGVIPKGYLPTYGEFHEGLWFRRGFNLRKRTITLNGQQVRCGIDLLFEATDCPGLVVGIEVCEDAWALIPPHRLQALAGAVLIGNLSASNETVGKDDYREQLVTGHSSEALCAYAYTSAGEGESTVDVVFGGHLMISELGAMLARKEPLSGEDEPLIHADVDIEHLAHERTRINSFHECAEFFKPMLDMIGFERIAFEVNAQTAQAPAKLARFVDAYPFLPAAPSIRDKRCRQVFKIQVRGLKKRLEHLSRKRGGIRKSVAAMEKSGRPVAVMGISGGADSTEVLVVAIKALDELGIPRKLLHCYALPGFGTTKRTYDNSHTLMKLLGVTVKEVNIRARCLLAWQEEGYRPFGIDVTGLTLDQFMEKLTALPGGSKDLGFENKQARARTDILMNAGFVIGTGDLSEQAAGWATYNADHMSMYNPNAGVPKTLVTFLISWTANNEFEGDLRKVLVDIAETEVSPELLPPGPNGQIAQKTNDTIGPADLRDFFLYHMVRWASRPSKIVRLAQQAKFYTEYTEEEIRKWLRIFIERFFDQRFKPECQPGGPLVGSVSLNPRFKWHHPSDFAEDEFLRELDADNARAAALKPAPAVVASVPLPAVAAPLPKVVKVLKVLLRVDVQSDFMPGGALPVPQGDQIVPVTNDLSRSGMHDLVVDTQDDHPADHGSFASRHEGKKPFDQVVLHGVDQTLWPDHCVHGTAGWQFHPDLDRSMVARTFPKGQDKRVDSYSGVFDNGVHANEAVRKQHDFLGRSTGLAEYLCEQADARGCDEIVVDCVGLALGYCVSFTATDLADLKHPGKKFRARVIKDATRAIELTPGDYDRELARLEACGVTVLTSADVLAGK